MEISHVFVGLKWNSKNAVYPNKELNNNNKDLSVLKANDPFITFNSIYCVFNLSESIKDRSL